MQRRRLKEKIELSETLTKKLFKTDSRRNAKQRQMKKLLKKSQRKKEERIGMKVLSILLFIMIANSKE
jgi:hypothetical protein